MKNNIKKEQHEKRNEFEEDTEKEWMKLGRLLFVLMCTFFLVHIKAWITILQKISSVFLGFSVLFGSPLQLCYTV